MIRLLLFIFFIGSFETSWAFGGLCSFYRNSPTDQFSRINDALARGVEGDLIYAKSTGSVFDPLYNEGGCFSESREEADRCTDINWLTFSMMEKADYIRATFDELLAAHELKYSSRILTCQALKESCFRSQDESPDPDSSASGLMQVTRATAKDLFKRGSKWFTPKVVGFEAETSGKEYHSKMATSIAAQMELGLAVMHQKRIDNGSDDIREMLKSYRGSDSKTNNAYADVIYSCADCIRKNDDQISEKCLREAANKCFDEKK